MPAPAGTRTDFGRITCPIVGMIAKNTGPRGALRKRDDEPQQTVDAFIMTGFPEH
jgi:hypothetical protein